MVFKNVSKNRIVNINGRLVDPGMGVYVTEEDIKRQSKVVIQFMAEGSVEIFDDGLKKKITLDEIMDITGSLVQKPLKEDFKNDDISTEKTETAEVDGDSAKGVKAEENVDSKEKEAQVKAIDEVKEEPESAAEEEIKREESEVVGNEVKEEQSATKPARRTRRRKSSSS